MAAVVTPGRKDDIGPQTKPLAGAPMSRRGALTGAATLAAALALSACADDPSFDYVPSVLTPQTSLLGSQNSSPGPQTSFPAPQADTELREQLDGQRELVVSGAHLNTGLLNRFYARHGYEPVWATRPAQANSLMAAVLRAGDQGLDPDLFHATLLRIGSPLSPSARELLLSDAFLTYADALARGAVPVERRPDDENLSPDPVDVAAVLDEAIDDRDPARVIEALAPTSPSYRALRQALQQARSGPASRKAPTDRVRTIEVNLERQRWLPRQLPPSRAWVNVADERLVLYREDRPVFSTRVVVGEDVLANQSPEFRATIDASFLNPPWVIPADITKAEILPKISHDPNYLAKNKMIMLANGEAEQLPGPDAGLGLIMFDMPNRFDVYLHDTPDRNVIFNRDNRRISHGCIRVQNPRDFAALLMDRPLEVIDQGIATGNTTRVDLPIPVPVFVLYQTAFVDTAGVLQFRPDFYHRDAAIWRLLQERPQAPAVTAQADASPTLAEPL